MGGGKDREIFRKQYFCNKCRIPLRGFINDASYGKMCIVCGQIPDEYPKPIGEKEAIVLSILNDLNLINPL